MSLENIEDFILQQDPHIFLLIISLVIMLALSIMLASAIKRIGKLKKIIKTQQEELLSWKRIAEIAMKDHC